MRSSRVIATSIRPEPLPPARLPNTLRPCMVVWAGSPRKAPVEAIREWVRLNERQNTHKAGAGTNFKLISPFTTRRFTWKRRACYCTNCTSTTVVLYRCSRQRRKKAEKRRKNHGKKIKICTYIPCKTRTQTYDTRTPNHNKVHRQAGAANTCLKRPGALGPSSNPRW